MKRALATCYCCGEQFAYFQVTKPRRYCSAPCEEKRTKELGKIRWLRRTAKRKAMAQDGLLPMGK